MPLTTIDKPSLSIVADENIPFVREFFSSMGTVATYPGREMQAAHVAQADVLLVRSVTSVNRQLLENSSVKFIGTCTIGTDHLDQEFLRERGIGFHSAPGCNANSVVEYVLSVLADLKPDWQSASFGIVGCGNVGGRLYRKLSALGLPVSVYDPFLSADSQADLGGLDQALAADVVCLHTPLTIEGAHPSRHLLNEARLRQLRPGSVLINAGRGPVIDNQALKAVLNERSDLTVALDVWEPEPALDIDLLNQVQRATPHIAGYSFDGKVEGTAMIYRALCQYLGVEPQINAAQLLRGDSSNRQSLALEAFDGTEQEIINQAILAAYRVADDDQRTRDLLTTEGCRLDSDVLAQNFDRLRKTYPKRREFPCFEIDSLPNHLSQKEKKSLSKTLATLGFTLASREES
ncbi:MAG: erythronate-4-phosphate dehydrogenase [Cellvibrionaceae bacterium]|nr:erythronate-4-phosphate dehydrogenase [Cellvibrionaceae bacterium]|tara:strand:- start:36048 stop:37262 length:1215 start_codon:yes stop_codon:yes gene_type:complete